MNDKKVLTTILSIAAGMLAYRDMYTTVDMCVYLQLYTYTYIHTYINTCIVFTLLVNCDCNLFIIKLKNLLNVVITIITLVAAVVVFVALVIVVVRFIVMLSISLSLFL